jgi:hypothetical protein
VASFSIRQAKEALQKPVIPAKAGVQDLKNIGKSALDWVPACAGMTAEGLLQRLTTLDSLSSKRSCRKVVSLAHLWGGAAGAPVATSGRQKQREVVYVKERHEHHDNGRHYGQYKQKAQTSR